MIKAKFSNSYDAKIKRIKRLPKLVGNIADTTAKKDATGIIEDFKNGIRKNNFGLKVLQDITIKRKRALGYSKPTTPLYGAGDDVTETYIDMFIVKKLKKGYRITPRWKMHHSGNVELRILFYVHENGAIINNGKALIRIPPRPAFRMAFQRYLRRKQKRETSKEVKKAIRETINTGNTNGFKRINK